jgi:hypothetical protein
MNRLSMIIGAVSSLLFAFAPTARAGDFTFLRHEASGSGWSNLFDGGPVVTAEGSTYGPTDERMFFRADDDSVTPGSFGAVASASGRSMISSIPVLDGLDGPHGFGVTVKLITKYLPSLFPGGDNPGGAAEGELFSVIEFVMPADDIEWSYRLSIDDSADFDGSTSVILENVTQSETLLELTSEVVPTVFATLSGSEGDLIRLTSLMSGSGSAQPGTLKGYKSSFYMSFTVPEPGTLSLLLFAGILITRRGSNRRIRYRSR